MKKEDIILKIMDEFDIARIDAAEIVNNIFFILRNSLIKGKHINIAEFGKFDVNYKKGEADKILKTISFSPVKKFSYDVNDSFNNLEPVTVAFITNFKEEDYPDVDMEDYEEVIDEIEEKDFVKSHTGVFEEKSAYDKAREETKEKFKEIFKEEFKKESSGKKKDGSDDERRKSYFESERYRNTTETKEETISDKILSETIDVIETRETIEDINKNFEIPKELHPDLTFIDREEPEEPLIVDFRKEEIEEVKGPDTTEEAKEIETHGYIPSEKEILDFEKIREELNNKIKETFGETYTHEPASEEIDENIENEIKEEVQPALTEDIADIESKEPEIRTPEESNILEEDLITRQEEATEEQKIEPKAEEQSFRDMFEEKEKLFDERNELLKEIEDKVAEEFARLGEDDFKDIDNDTIKKIEDINKATEEKLKAQAPDDDIKIPDFDFKNLFKDSHIPETEPPIEEDEGFDEEIEEETTKFQAKDNKDEYSFEGSDILIPEEIKQLHEEIQTVKPYEGIESKKEETLFKNGDDEDVKFDFFKDYDDVFENKDGGTEMRVVHPSDDAQMPYPKKDLTDEQKEGSKIFSLSIMILIGIVIAVFAGIYFLLSSDLFKSKPTPVMLDTVKTQSARPIMGDSVKQNQQIGDTVKGKDSVTASQQTQKSDTPKTPQTTTAPIQNNQTASNPEDSQYRKLNPGEEEQINDPANSVVYIRTTDGVFIQTGSYKEKAVAEEKANALKKKGVQNVNVVEANLGAKGIYYRVRVGKYSTVQEAKNNSSKVKN